MLHALAFAFSSSLLSAPLRFSPGDAAKQKKLAFLALAFREFDVDKNNTMTAEEFRRALAGFMPDDAISQCFQVLHLLPEDYSSHTAPAPPAFLHSCASIAPDAI